MPLLDALFSVGAIRKTLWRLWYPFLTRRLRHDDVVFLNYAYETEPPLAVPLAPEDEVNRPCIQLYHAVASEGEFAGKDVLEVSCGHGGGASWLMRTRRPARYTALDLNAAGIAFCRERHRAVAGLDFVRGDAGRLPFADASFDVVLNVEASHCYPDFAGFLAEVSRVLRPGGRFLYADFRFGGGAAGDDFSAWERALAAAPLVEVSRRGINAEVRRGMELNAARSLALIARHLPRCLHGLGRDFAGVPGSRVYNALVGGALSYRIHVLDKK